MNIAPLNVIGASAVRLQEQVKLLNQHGFKKTLTGNETYKELQALVKEGQDALGVKKGEEAPKRNTVNAAAAPSDAVYVWLKTPAYVDKEGTKRVAGGFYHIALADFPRLAKLPREAGEIFAELPTRKLTEIAKWFGINVEKYTDEELLERLVSVPTLY